MNPQPPELLPQRPIRSDFGRAPSYRTRRILTITVAVICLLVSARLIFGNPFAHSGEIATIKAEGAWKQKPEQPGGIDIPNQNVQVYQALDNKDATKPPIEHLLPPPETPLSTVPAGTPAASNGVVAQPAPQSASSAPPIENLAPPKLDIDTIIPPAPAPVAAPPVPETITPNVAPAPIAAPVTTIESIQTHTSANQTPTPVVVAVPAVTPAITAPHAAKTKPMTIAEVLKDTDSLSKTDRIIQVASVQDQSYAEDMAEKLQTRYTSVLGTVRLHVVQAKVAGKGTYYRIQSGPISADHASHICTALHNMKAGCILVRP